MWHFLSHYIKVPFINKFTNLTYFSTYNPSHPEVCWKICQTSATCFLSMSNSLLNSLNFSLHGFNFNQPIIHFIQTPQVLVLGHLNL
ncbi:hypothetical protein VIGAN_04077800, partial [Vigna angularis var. angularis]